MCVCLCACEMRRERKSYRHKDRETDRGIVEKDTAYNAYPQPHICYLSKFVHVTAGDRRLSDLIISLLTSGVAVAVRAISGT